MGIAILPIAIWAVHFTVSYGFTAFACARQMSGAVPWVVGVASALALAALIAVAVRSAGGSRLPDALAAGLGGLAMIAVVWEASALIWVPACA